MNNVVLIEQNAEGWAYLITCPSTLESCQRMMDIRFVEKGFEYKILSLCEALSHTKLVGKALISDKYLFRILDSKREPKVFITGTWLTIEQAKELVNYDNGEMIYQYDYNCRPLWEVL